MASLKSSLKEAMEKIKSAALVEVERRAREIVECCYCPIHGQFASIQATDPSDQDSVRQLRWSVCCEGLRLEIERTLDAHGAFHAGQSD